VRSGDKVLDGAVSGEIGAKDFTRARVGIRHHQRDRQWAPEV